MALLLVLCLILANAHVGLAMANELKAHNQTAAHSSAEPFSNPPAPSPSEAEPPMIRRLANQQTEVTKSSGSPSPSPTNEKASPEEEKDQPSEENGLDQTPLESVTEHSLSVRVQNNKHHHSIDKSVAGGGVILGGLATTFLVAVFCYIRATGRHKNETFSTTSSTPGSPANV